MKEVLKDFDYQEQGGVPLLGVNGVCMIGHGRSTPKAIKNLVFRADYMYKKNLIKKFESSIKQYSHL
jgi:glycerol-3-phosphate acyltransferase PlsX